jgi:hypothetical protein
VIAAWLALAQLQAQQPTPAPPAPPLPPLPPEPPDIPLPPDLDPFQVVPTLPPSVVIIALSFFAMLVLIAVGIPIARAFARRMDRQALEPPRNPEIFARLDNIERAVESIAIEVERISEGQRYTTKLFTERMGGLKALERGVEGERK